MKKLFSFLLVLFLGIYGFGQPLTKVYIGGSSGPISYGETGYVDIVFSNPSGSPAKMGANIHPESVDNGYIGKYPEGTQNADPGHTVTIRLNFKHSFTTPRVAEYKFKAYHGLANQPTNSEIIIIYVNYTSNNIPCNLSAPTNLQNNSITDSQANFSWNSVSGASGYRIAIYTPQGLKYYDTDTNNRLIINLDPNTIYKWSVATKCTSGVIGKYSSEKTFTSAPFICQDVMNITNPIINSKEYKSRNVINANSSISDNLNVIFRSNTIFLKPGFKTQKSKFRAYVKPCVKDNELLVSDNEELVAYIGIGNDDSVLENNLNSLSSNTTPNTFTISPNPTSDQVQINSTVGINEWFVYDINAKIVLSGNNKNVTALRVNLQTLPAGLYYFKFQDSSGVLYEKTIIKK